MDIENVSLRYARAYGRKNSGKSRLSLWPIVIRQAPEGWEGLVRVGTGAARVIKFWVGFLVNKLWWPILKQSDGY